MKDSIQALGLEGTSLISGVTGVWGGFSRNFSDLINEIETKKSPGKNLMTFTTTQEDDSILEPSNSNEQGDFNEFIRKMIQIKEILRVSGNEESINLPNIVVIGSQSSGKSSVLESIVGHEFLPKGQNMVTRRPLELTLVHSPSESEDSVIISQYDRNLKITDFKKVQNILKDLNMAVPEDEWISFDPIRVTIYSSKVPDLTLIDLPGYIQVTNKTQPAALRDKIRVLCDKYIKSNNLILAVCAADVDLANSEALKASRKFDPKGNRTIGVITKLDLVDANYAASLVANEDYPLTLGYIGVVCKGLPDGHLPLGNSQQASPSILARITGKTRHQEDPRLAFEAQYFEQNQQAYAEIQDRLGLLALRRVLTSSLEDIMSRSLGSVVLKVAEDLEELKYQLKAQYNDRFVSPEAYVSDLVSSLKREFAHLSRKFTRNQIDLTLRELFNQKLIEICDDQIWTKMTCIDETTGSDPYRKLNQCLSSFTRSGVGKFTANFISDAIYSEIEMILNRPPFTFHSDLRNKITSAADAFLKSKCQTAMEQVENSMKPYKQGIEFTPRDWKDARRRLIKLFEAEEIKLQKEIEVSKNELGPKRLKRAVEYLQSSSDESLTSPSLVKAKLLVHNSALLKRLQQRKDILKKESSGELDSVQDYRHRSALWTRILSIFGNDGMNDPLKEKDDSRILLYEPPSNGNCNDLTIFKDPCQTKFPEIYLFLVMDRFLKTCSTFVHYELVSEFLQPFPDNIVSADSVALEGHGGGILSLTKMSPKQLRDLLRENPEIAAHLDMQEKFRALEDAFRKLNQMNRINK